MQQIGRKLRIKNYEEQERDDDYQDEEQQEQNTWETQPTKVEAQTSIPNNTISTGNFLFCSLGCYGG